LLPTLSREVMARRGRLTSPREVAAKKTEENFDGKDTNGAMAAIMMLLFLVAPNVRAAHSTDKTTDDKTADKTADNGRKKLINQHRQQKLRQLQTRLVQR